MKVALDTNCFIDATNRSSSGHPAMRCIMAAGVARVIVICVSEHTLFELKCKPDAALVLAGGVSILPHFPIGSWDEQVTSWDQVVGTWDKAKQNQSIQEELRTLANAGNDIRDRGAYLDALHSGVDVFVTSDTQFAASAPAKRITDRFGLRVLTPQQLADELCEPCDKV